MSRSSGSAASAALAPALADRLGVTGIDPDLFVRSLTHRSYAYENGGLPTNERLEFLGDSVLGLVVTDTLYRLHPDLAEGQLAKLRAAVVNMRALATIARGVGVGEFILLGRGEETTGGRDKSSILADTLEALLGAVYLGLGLDAASALVHRLFDPVIAASAEMGAGLDWKTSLQELTATAELGVPEYRVTETGPDHEKTFAAVVLIAGVGRGAGSGKSKKEAEQRAAELAWRDIRAGVAAGSAPRGVAGLAPSGAADAVAAEVVAAAEAAAIVSAADVVREPVAADRAVSGSETVL